MIIGGPQESALARAIQRQTPRARDLTGHTDFARIAILGAKAVLAVGNDTGPLHLAAAAGAPTIVLFSKGLRTLTLSTARAGDDSTGREPSRPGCGPSRTVRQFASAAPYKRLLIVP